MKKRILFLVLETMDLMSPVYYDHNRKYNTGDFVYFIAGISYFYDDSLDVTFIKQKSLEDKIRRDGNWVKNNFDICIHMEANILNPVYIGEMLEKAKLFKQMQVPIFILGVGTQSSIDYSTKFLTEIRESAKLYLDAIMGSGGSITARGYFTQYIVEKLGFSKVFVSGCPSLYYMGERCNVIQRKVGKDEFRPALNGEYISSIDNKIYEDNPTALFFDQGHYLPELYEPNRVSKYESHIYPFVKLYEESRIDGDMNYWLWSKRIKETCNFSYGTRIHGNIIALQNEIAAFVKVCDSRVREIVEFFDIPNSMNTKFDEKKDSLYDLYRQLDYKKYMQTRDKCFRKFSKWLEEKKIPNVLGKNNAYKNLLDKFNYYDYRKDDELNHYKEIIIDKFPRF